MSTAWFRAVIAGVLLAVTGACSREPPQSHETRQAEAKTTVAATSKSWTFAVLSDLHVPRDGTISAKLQHAVSAVTAVHPRFVVITGDFTDGEPFDPPWRIREAPRWWDAVHRLLRPLHDAGIPILPIAGNHDSYLRIYRSDYVQAWRDLDRWAAPLQIRGMRQARTGIALDAAPFSYSVDVEDVHLTLTYVVGEWLEPEVARFIEHDLASARSARYRIVFGHVPLSSVATVPRLPFVAKLGRILSDGDADLYVAGHEHLVWDDNVAIPGGHVRQVIVGTPAASWRFGPDLQARRRAICESSARIACCKMPSDRTPFGLHLEGAGWYENERHAFTLFTIGQGGITAQPFAIGDDGTVRPFGQDCVRTSPPSIQ